MDKKLLFHYRKARAHQMAVAANDGGALTVDPSGRTELSYASAPYGEHAISAYMSAKRAIYYQKQRMKARVLDLLDGA